MNTTLLLLAAKVAAAASIGLLIGLEREWAHKEVGVRSFTIATLLGTLSWMISSTLAYIEVGVIITVIIFVNIHMLVNNHPLEMTTSLALATSNVLGILVGMDAFFVAFASAIVITALLSWKTEMVAFTSKLTVAEIRSTLLLGFITAIVYPLLPDRYIDPWQILNPRGVWLTVMIVSALSFVNYVLLRQFGMRGMRYSAILGGLVNSAAISALLGRELKQDPDFAVEAPSDFLMADMAMIFRNGVLVIIFSWQTGFQTSLAIAMVLGPMLLVALIIAAVLFLRTWKMIRPSQQPPLTSPLALRSVLRFGLLFLSLTVVSGLMQRFFGAVGFLITVIVGALASAASSAILVGGNVNTHLITASTAAIAIYLASIVGLVENLVIFYSVTGNRKISLSLLYSSLPILLTGALAIVLAQSLHWW